MTLKSYLFLLSTLLIFNHCSAFKIDHNKRSIRIKEDDNQNITKSDSIKSSLIKNSSLIAISSPLNEITLIKPSSNFSSDVKSSKMMMSSFPIALIFGAKAVFFKKFLIGSLISQKFCCQTTQRPGTVPGTAAVGGVRPPAVGGVGGIRPPVFGGVGVPGVG